MPRAYAFWIHTFGQHDADDQEPLHTFKGVGELTDVQASIARVALDIDDEQILDVRIEPMASDG